MNGLVKNNYKENPVWIKSCENFRSGENTFKQPEYFHTDDDVYIRDWYKAAYPTDTWGASQIPDHLTFKNCRASDGYVLIRYTLDGEWHHFNPDSVLRSRIYKECHVNDGLSFGYTIED